MSRSAAASRTVVPMALVLLMAAPPADAQVWGRKGSSWQPEIRWEREKLAAFQASLDRLTREQWRKRAEAWLELEAPKGDRLRVAESAGVRDLDLKRGVEVRPLDDPEAPSSWELVFKKKPPKKLTVVMTAGDGTREPCPLGPVLAEGGALGIFRYRHALICVARAPDVDEVQPSGWGRGGRRRHGRG